ncbi:putative endolysin [Serratia phage vB_SmaS-Totoro]|nr:putative endolysin [Serratia phage vB_SmaS-Totoro]
MRMVFWTLVLCLVTFSFPATASVSVNQAGWNKHKTVLLSTSKRADVNMMDLVILASIESTMGQNRHNRSSSAAGLFGFTDRTWRVMVKRYGKQYGIKPGTSKQNPRANALMAAEYIKENQRYLESQLHRKVGIEEIYMAHLLGPGDAAKILKARNNRYASSVAPGAARSNKAFFYDKGRARTVAGFKQYVHQKVNSHRQAYRSEVVLLAYKHQLPLNLADAT